MTAPADINQPNGPRATLVPLPRYGAVACPACPEWEAHRREAYIAEARVLPLDCPACGGLRFVRVDVDALRVWPAKEDGS